MRVRRFRSEVLGTPYGTAGAAENTMLLQTDLGRITAIVVGPESDFDTYYIRGGDMHADPFFTPLSFGVGRPWIGCIDADVGGAVSIVPAVYSLVPMTADVLVYYDEYPQTIDYIRSPKDMMRHASGILPAGGTFSTAYMFPTMGRKRLTLVVDVGANVPTVTIESGKLMWNPDTRPPSGLVSKHNTAWTVPSAFFDGNPAFMDDQFLRAQAMSVFGWFAISDLLIVGIAFTNTGEGSASFNVHVSLKVWDA